MTNPGHGPATVRISDPYSGRRVAGKGRRQTMNPTTMTMMMLHKTPRAAWAARCKHVTRASRLERNGHRLTAWVVGLAAGWAALVAAAAWTGAC